MKSLNIFSQEETLLINALGLNGYSIEELANSVSWPLPQNLNYNKGFIGTLIEFILGSDINNKIGPDFPKLNIELKTIPICCKGYPLENTFICYVPLFKNVGLTWKESYFFRKIKKILWIPIKGNRSNSFFKKTIGNAFIWTPNKSESYLLKQDWEDFMDLIISGKIENIRSQHGFILQIKKKCKKNILTKCVDQIGRISLTSPRAFYFKKNFTLQLLKKNAF